MATTTEIKADFQQLQTLKSLVKVTGEIASSRMQRARNAVLYRREFMSELVDVFATVRASHLRKVKKLEQEKKNVSKTKFTTLAHNGKTVSVFLAANTRLYGDLLTRVFEEFYEDYRANNREVTIVGSVGVEMFRLRAGDVPMTNYAIADDRVNSDRLGEIASHLAQYEEIHLFYGRYLNPLKQEVRRYVISSNMEFEIPEKQDVEAYLYEPSLEKVMAFFEREIFSVMFEQTVVESQLAKFAARFTAMDRAEQAIDKRLDGMQKMMLKRRHMLMNKKQLHAMAPLVARGR